MRTHRINHLIVIENDQFNIYCFDNRKAWKIGRPSKGNIPDIKMNSPTISRKQGEFKNIDGVWFYVDRSGRGSGIYNNKHISNGLGGRIKPLIMKDRDILLFGSKGRTINDKTVWCMFLERSFADEWRKITGVNCVEKLIFKSENNVKIIENPQKGEVVETDAGMAICMGDIIYLTGDISVTVH